MADNYNLIPAAELPVTEAEEVDVLCVEGGELKRKPAANLGGGGYVIRLAASDFENLGEMTPDDYGAVLLPVMSENYDNFIEILLAGGSVWIDWAPFLSMAGLTDTVAYSSATAWCYVNSEGQNAVIVRTELCAAMGIDIQAMTFNLFFINGTWTPAAAASTEEA